MKKPFIQVIGLLTAVALMSEPVPAFCWHNCRAPTWRSQHQGSALSKRRLRFMREAINAVSISARFSGRKILSQVPNVVHVFMKFARTSYKTYTSRFAPGQRPIDAEG